MNKTQKIALALAELNAFHAIDGKDQITKYDPKVHGLELTAYRTAKKAAELAAEKESEEAARIAALNVAPPQGTNEETGEPDDLDLDEQKGGEQKTEETEGNEPAVDEANRAWFTGKVGDRVTKNGVRAPRRDTLCGAAWALFDRMYAAGTVDTTAIVDAGVAEGLNRGNLRTELSTWRRFHGVARVGVTAPAAAPVVETPAAPEAPANEGGEQPTAEGGEQAPVVETASVE